MKLSWPVSIGGTGGPTWGYRTVSENLRAALEAEGVMWDDAAPVALHVGPAHLFEPVEGVVNIALTMFEVDGIPSDLVWRLTGADLVVVPCDHNRTALRWAGYRRPIRVVPLGLAAAHLVDVLPRPAGPFRFLWVGQAQARKGWHLVNAAFAAAFPGRLDVELMLKTVSTRGAVHKFHIRTGRIQVIAETYTDAQMAALYRSAHAFVFPSYGEGWGLPALEAMAAECLVLAPAHTGLGEFFDGQVGWVLPWQRVAATYGMPVTAYAPKLEALVDRMTEAVASWDVTATLRRRARDRALTFTWTHTARRLLDVMAPLSEVTTARDAISV